MITTIHKKDLKRIIDEEDFDYQYMSLITDKLRAIYTLFGWVHMMDKFEHADDVVTTLVMNVYKELEKGAKETNCCSAGIMVTGWFDDEDILNIDYYFNLA